MRIGQLAVLVGLLVPASAAAHQKSVSYSKWTLVADGAVVEAKVRWLELTSLPGTLGERDAPFEREQVLSYLQEHLYLDTESGPCVAKPASEVWLPAEQGWFRVEWRVSCDGAARNLHSRLFTSLTNHVHFASVLGTPVVDLVLSPAAPVAAVAPTSASSGARGIGAYVRLGVEHILTGWDHLAFLFLLIVVASRARDVAVLITGFTVGHSVTLAAAALGFVVPNVRAVEATIAASILIVALENADMERVRGGPLVILLALALFGAAATFAGLPAFWGVMVFTGCYFALLRTLGGAERLRWVVACLFGFVHGLGFSGVLLEQELPRAELVQALFGFNVGVELGQLAIVVLAWPLLRWMRAQERGSMLIDAASFAGASVGVFALVVRAFG